MENQEKDVVKNQPEAGMLESAASPAGGEAVAKVQTEKPKAPAPKKSPVEVPAEKYLVTSSPHIFDKDNVSKIMWTVNICLLPAGIASVYIFGLRALATILLAIIGAVGAEWAWQKFTHRKITIKDGSAFLTGLLLAYNLPPGVPWWLPLVGSAFAIIIVKQFFGGLGMNIFNPALAARAFLLASWPQEMTTWSLPALNPFAWDLKTGATPLNLIKMSVDSPDRITTFWAQFTNTGGLLKNLLLGIRGGCIGETCSVLLILGGLYLIYKKYIDWQIPACYIGTVVVFTTVAYLMGLQRGGFDVIQNLIFHLFSGGLMLGAFYMATDYVSSPATVEGRMIFAVGCGFLTSVIRLWGGYPEGVCYSILIMNMFVPLIDDKVRSRVYGVRKEKQPA